MAINKNHEFDELNGVKCSIVEKNVSKERAGFLKELLELNGFEVVVISSPPPKIAAAPKPASPAPDGSADPEPQPPAAPPPAETFTVGVTNLAFNPTNALFGRLLKTKDGHVVTPAYWYQKEPISHDEVPYFESAF
jgi:hypothetical protein